MILVDTPGIGDSEDVHQDQINMQNVVNAVAALPYLNLIAKFLKATDCHITENYRYCITELLKRLHISAMTNIAFCFTLSRMCLFRPTDAIRTLDRCLSNMKDNHGVVLQVSMLHTLPCGPAGSGSRTFRASLIN